LWGVFPLKAMSNIDKPSFNQFQNLDNLLDETMEEPELKWPLPSDPDDYIVNGYLMKRGSEVRRDLKLFKEMDREFGIEEEVVDEF
jgi:hypothetical protein